MKFVIDLKKLDYWLLDNCLYTQDDRELIIECLGNYIEEKKLKDVKK